MSYEGYVEFLCENGHYSSCDCNANEPRHCEACGAQMAYRHSVDETNGSNDDEPWTISAPRVMIGADDDWRQDHYGNRYAVQVVRWKPVGNEWQAAAREEKP